MGQACRDWFVDPIFTNSWWLWWGSAPPANRSFYCFCLQSRYQTEFLPCMRHFYMHHLIRRLEGDETNDTFLILQSRSTSSKRLHNLCQATQLVSVRVRIRVQNTEFPGQWSLHFAGMLFYMFISCVWLWLINIICYILVVARRALLIHGSFSDLPLTWFQVLAQDPDFCIPTQSYKSGFSEKRPNDLSIQLATLLILRVKIFEKQTLGQRILPRDPSSQLCWDIWTSWLGVSNKVVGSRQKSVSSLKDQKEKQRKVRGLFIQFAK